MSTVAQVATALASTISTATGLRKYDYVPEDLNPPALIVAIETIDTTAFKLGEMTMVFSAVVLTSKASDRAGQFSAYDYMAADGTKSVMLAVYSTPSLGLPDTNAAVLRMRNLSFEEIAAYGYCGAAFDVLVLTAGAASAEEDDMAWTQITAGLTLDQGGLLGTTITEAWYRLDTTSKVIELRAAVAAGGPGTDTSQIYVDCSGFLDTLALGFASNGFSGSVAGVADAYLGSVPVVGLIPAAPSGANRLSLYKDDGSVFGLVSGDEHMQGGTINGIGFHVVGALVDIS